MLRFVAKRVFSSVLLLFVVMMITFVMVFSRGDVIARQLLGYYAADEQVAQRAHELGLDQPVLSQFFRWAGNALQGDLGTSWFTSEPVTSSVMSRLGVTLPLVTIVILLTAILSIVLGLLAARKRGWVDSLVQGGAILGAAIPSFIIAIFLVTVFAIQLGWFPATGWVAFTQSPSGWLRALTLPAIGLLIGAVANTAQQVRSSLIDVLRRDYVRTLRSRGLGEREILYVHILRSASPPGLTILALQFVGMLSGTMIIEQVFALPGLGQMAVQATSRGDLPSVLGVVLVSVMFVIVVNLAIDIVVGWLNPKVRIS